MSNELFVMFAAHMVADFPLQSDYIAANKLNSWSVRTLHVAVHWTLTASLLLFFINLQTTLLLATSVAIIHHIIDTRRWAEPKEGFEDYPIWVDQSFHIFSIVWCGVLFL